MARPSSPTSLLWVHQLKRENGHLLKRMQDLEASNERQAKRVKTIETNAKSGADADIATLAKQIKTLDESGVGRRLAHLEHEVKQKTQDLEAGSEAITVQIAAMRKESDATGEEKRKAFSREKTLLKRIGELETGLKTYEQSLVQVGRRVDESRLEQIRDQLKGLSKQLTAEGSQMKRLTESVAVLEVANEELRKSNQGLAAQIEKLAARPTAVVEMPQSIAKAGNDRDLLSSTIEAAPLKAKKKGKKHHKWSGGGADRDIIMSGTQLLSDTTLTSRMMQQGDTDQLEDSDDEAQIKTTRTVPKSKQKYKPIPPHLRLPTSDGQANSKKSHKWAGGGTDRDIIRSGRGWIEVATSPDAGDEPAGASSKLLPPGPSKRIATPRWTLKEAMTQGRVTRRCKPGHTANVQDMAKQTMPPVPAATSVRTKHVGPPAPAKINAKTKDATGKSFAEIMKKPQQRQPGKNTFTSPSVILSPPNPRLTPEAIAPAPRRRRILQD